MRAAIFPWQAEPPYRNSGHKGRYARYRGDRRLSSMTGILNEGRNCQCFAQAEQVGFLVDGQNYYRAVQEAVQNAEESILIAAWDIDSRMRLAGGTDEHGAQLGTFLDEVVSRKEALRAYLLSWDFSLIFALEREPFPAFKLGWRTHKRLKFHLDGHHPPTGSHHQKIVVIDDALAFTGGMDLSIRRWDSREHKPNDPHRIDPTGKPYNPFHDVQIAVSGEAAMALGQIVRERWVRATHETIKERPLRKAKSSPCSNPWPASLRPALKNVQVAISLTEPAFDGRPPIQEIRQLYTDALAHAQHFVYIENQYLTAAAVGDALQALLKREEPPEIVIVLPRVVSGWLQRKTMGALSAQLIMRLRAADKKNVLRIYYPEIDGLNNSSIKVHSKLLVVDNEFLTIGSANINNRSFGLDSECNISLEGNGDHTIQQAIVDLRDDLLSEHLGLSVASLRQRRETAPSWIALIDSMRTNKRRLEPFQEARIEPFEPAKKTLITDPERPIDPRELIAAYVPDQARHHVARHLLRNALILLALLSFAGIWHFSPLHEWLNVQRLVNDLHLMGALTLAPLVVWGAYLIGGLIFFPVTVLIVVTAIAFPPPWNLLYAFLGCLSSASLNYALGQLIGHHALDRLAQGQWRELRHQLRRRGLGAMVAATLVPVAPFTLVTSTAGALNLKYRDLFLGTLIGVAPGILTVTVVAHSVTTIIRSPAGIHLFILALLALILIGLTLGFRHWIKSPEQKDTAVTYTRK